MTSETVLERIARIDGDEKAAGRVAEIGHRIQRDIRHRLAEDDVEHEQIVDGRMAIADAARESFGRLHGETGSVQGRKSATSPLVTVRGVACAMIFAEAEILEEAARTGLCGDGVWHDGPRHKSQATMSGQRAVRQERERWSDSGPFGQPGVVVGRLSPFPCAKLEAGRGVPTHDGQQGRRRERLQWVRRTRWRPDETLLTHSQRLYGLPCGSH